MAKKRKEKKKVYTVADFEKHKGPVWVKCQACGNSWQTSVPKLFPRKPSQPAPQQTCHACGGINTHQITDGRFWESVW